MDGTDYTMPLQGCVLSGYYNVVNLYYIPDRELSGNESLAIILVTLIIIGLKTAVLSWPQYEEVGSSL